MPNAGPHTVSDLKTKLMIELAAANTALANAKDNEYLIAIALLRVRNVWVLLGYGGGLSYTISDAMAEFRGRRRHLPEGSASVNN